jgi:hypothetical protein
MELCLWTGRQAPEGGEPARGWSHEVVALAAMPARALADAVEAEASLTPTVKHIGALVTAAKGGKPTKG